MDPSLPDSHTEENLHHPQALKHMQVSVTGSIFVLFHQPILAANWWR